MFVDTFLQCGRIVMFPITESAAVANRVGRRGVFERRELSFVPCRVPRDQPGRQGRVRGGGTAVGLPVPLPIGVDDVHDPVVNVDAPRNLPGQRSVRS